MFRTGVGPRLEGCKGFETKARKLSRLLLCWLLLGLLYLPQDTRIVATMRTTRVIALLFKPGTPQNMRDRDLDAKKRIIAEPIGGICLGGPGRVAEGAKPPFILYSQLVFSNSVFSIQCPLTF
jgi:hypothetical protein